MNCSKVGELILKLRKEKNMTQNDVADMLNISGKTISKWERGAGCPDITLLNELSDIFGVDIKSILTGDFKTNKTNGGNMKKIKFYICPDCKNVIIDTGNADIYCCGRILNALSENIEDSKKSLIIEDIENEYCITIPHEMSKSHYISFAAYVSYDSVMLIKLYPEQNAEFRLPKMNRGTLYIGCNKHGLWKNII